MSSAAWAEHCASVAVGWRISAACLSKCCSRADIESPCVASKATWNSAFCSSKLLPSSDAKKCSNKARASAADGLSKKIFFTRPGRVSGSASNFSLFAVMRTTRPSCSSAPLSRFCRLWRVSGGFGFATASKYTSTSSRRRNVNGGSDATASASVPSFRAWCLSGNTATL
eukprot:Amastigsp_a509240_7.p3 type:complete len:170 gc:universal Amastigsp_a509240_7:1267-758(-)